MTGSGLSRRGFIAAAAAFLAARADPAAAAGWPLHVTDAIGRDVIIPAQPKAVLLGSGFNLIALSLIHPDPVSILAGWADDMRADNKAIYEAFVAKFPALEKVPVVGNGLAADGLSFEAILSLTSDLAIMSIWQADTEPGKRAMAYLTELGVPVVVVDFNRDPLRNTPRDMRMLGRILGREQQAEDFATFYETRLNRIKARAPDPKTGPVVLMDAFPSKDRGSWAFGRTGLGELITLAGGRNVAAENMPPQGGPVTSEYIIAADPAVYIATGSPGGTYGTFSIGPGVSLAEAKATLEETTKLPHLAMLKAVQENHVYGLWNFFNAVPLNILAAEAVARWVRPDIYGDIDPVASLAEINQRFAAVAFEGAYWAGLQG